MAEVARGIALHCVPHPAMSGQAAGTSAVMADTAPSMRPVQLMSTVSPQYGMVHKICCW